MMEPVPFIPVTLDENGQVKEVEWPSPMPQHIHVNMEYLGENRFTVELLSLGYRLDIDHDTEHLGMKGFSL